MLTPMNKASTGYAPLAASLSDTAAKRAKRPPAKGGGTFAKGHLLAQQRERTDHTSSRVGVGSEPIQR